MAGRAPDDARRIDCINISPLYFISLIDLQFLQFLQISTEYYTVIKSLPNVLVPCMLCRSEST